MNTPGPWTPEVEPDYKSDDDTAVLRTGWINGADGIPVTSYGDCGSHKCVVSDADMALLCAAPDLADALEELLNIAEREFPRDWSELTKARAALRKAGHFSDEHE